MNESFRPLTPFPQSAFKRLWELCLRIACLEHKASEASTFAARMENLAAHPATRRFFDELEFLHASHARTLHLHIASLSDAGSLTTPDIAKDLVGPSDSVSSASDPEEILISAYSQLNNLAAHYTRLHTLALALEHASTADLSLNHLKEITPKIMACSQAIPLLTADQTIRRFGHISAGCAETALEATQAAWKNETHFPETT